jgi:hypothetical protein
VLFLSLAGLPAFNGNDRLLHKPLQYGLGIPNPLDKEPMPPDLHPQALGNPSDSARMGYALRNLESRRDKAPEIDQLHFFCRETTGDRMTNQDVQ